MSGLVVGSDIIEQIQNYEKSDILLIPCNMLRYDRDLFLDNTSIKDIEEALKVKVIVVEKNGADLVQKITGQYEENAE